MTIFHYVTCNDYNSLRIRFDDSSLRYDYTLFFVIIYSRGSLISGRVFSSYMGYTGRYSVGTDNENR